MNQFNNDGSFLNQFKRSMQTPQTSVSQGVNPQPPEKYPGLPSTSSSGSFTQLSTNASSTQVKFSNDGSFLEMFRKSQPTSPPGLPTKMHGDVNVKRQPGLPQPSSSGLSLSLSKRSEPKRVGAAPAGPPIKLEVFQEEDSVNSELDPKTLETVEKVARNVAENGPQAEENARNVNKTNPNYWFLRDTSSAAYAYYRERIQHYTKGVSGPSGSAKPVAPPSVIRAPKVEPPTYNAAPPPALTVPKVVSYPILPSVASGAVAASAAVSSSGSASPDVTRQRKRKSRWSEEPATSAKPTATALLPQPGTNASIVAHVPPPGVVNVFQLGTTVTPSPAFAVPVHEQASQLLSDDVLNSARFAQQMIGGVQLSEDQKKQLRDQQQLKAMQQAILAKQTLAKIQTQAIVAGAVKAKFDYDSDEDTEDGTWEHKLRRMEMEKTRLEAQKLTAEAAGKHHIADFLPEEELAKFMRQNTRDAAPVDTSLYQENKLSADNVGFQLLRKMGWKEGQGLGSEAKGITAPINQGKTPVDNQGLGASSSQEPAEGDDEFDTYRKRMMLAYRFRPNPLNNPRRQYY